MVQEIFWVGSNFPNGLFKTTFRVFDELDENIGTLTFHIEAYSRQRALQSV
jgi:hypothetical protein